MPINYHVWDAMLEHYQIDTYAYRHCRAERLFL